MNRKGIQLIILGDGAVGKTSMIKQYSNKEFSNDHIVTIGLDYASVKYTTKINNKVVPVKIWDTAG
jgi:GTPase SAR1 family protein